MEDPATVLERRLLRVLPPGWFVHLLRSRSGGQPTVVELNAPDGSACRLSVVVIEDNPLAVRSLAARPDRRDVIAVAQWLGPRTREQLAHRGVNFVDATGNARVVIDDPAVFIARDGTGSRPSERAEVLLRRPSAVKFMRYLVAMAPKVTVTELARATRLSTGLVSELLKVLDQKGLVWRGARGRLEEIALEGLLLQLADSYDLSGANDAYSFRSLAGWAELVEAIRRVGPRAIISGAAAAGFLTPLPPSHTLLLYASEPVAVAAELGLTRASEGGDVVLLEPGDSLATDHAWTNGSLWFAAPPQIVLDCFANDEAFAGEAAMQWTLDHVDLWRAHDWYTRAPSADPTPMTTSARLRTDRT